jgi:hypothetical protein
LVEEVVVMDDVWAADPDAQVVDHVEHSEIIVEPEPADERVRDAEFGNRQMEEAAREQAQAHHINRRIMGASSPSPEIEQWPERYRKAFEDELARLEAVGAGRAEGGPS